MTSNRPELQGDHERWIGQVWLGNKSLVGITYDVVEVPHVPSLISLGVARPFTNKVGKNVQTYGGRS